MHADIEDDHGIGGFGNRKIFCSIARSLRDNEMLTGEITGDQSAE